MVTIEIKGPFKAKDLFELKDDKLRKGHVAFADKKAVLLPESKKNRDQFLGPGIYGVFCKGELSYVGLYAGYDGHTWKKTVLDRWFKHLTYFSLRSPKISCTPANMVRILSTLPGEPSEAFAEKLRGKHFTEIDLASMDAPFLTKGTSFTYNKASFATRHWDIFQPGKEEEMLSEVSFVFGRFRPKDVAGLVGSISGTRKGYELVKQKWLKPTERVLIEEFKPICNYETKIPKPPGGMQMFIDALEMRMVTPRPFDASSNLSFAAN